MIHVCYSTSNDYAKFAGTSIVSLFENISLPAPSVTIHILHDDALNYENWKNFIYIAGKYGQRIEFHNVNQNCEKQVKFLRENFSEQTHHRFSINKFYRLLIKNLVNKDITKVIYLDADTIVNLDITELWRYDLGDYTVAATPEIEATRNYMITDKYLLHSGKVNLKDYFCSGIMIFNLEKWDEDFFEKGVSWRIEHSQCECYDQDILNNFFSKNYLKLPEKFDSFVGPCRAIDNNMLFPKIYHYAGKRLGLDFDDAFDKIFFTHFIKTPWFGMNTLRNAYEIMRQIYVERQIFAANVVNAMADKERAFFVTSRNIEGMRSLFAIKETEELIVADEPDAMDKLIDSMQRARGRKFFFMMIDNFAEVNVALNQLFFVAGEDFIDSTAFLHDGHGVPLPAFKLVQLLL